MVDNLECYRTKLLLKRDSLNNKIPMVYVKYNVPKAIRTLGVDEKGKAFTAPARLNRISQISKTLRSAYERKLADRKSKLIVHFFPLSVFQVLRSSAMHAQYGINKAMKNVARENCRFKDLMVLFLT